MAHIKDGHQDLHRDSILELNPSYSCGISRSIGRSSTRDEQGCPLEQFRAPSHGELLGIEGIWDPSISLQRGRSNRAKLKRSLPRPIRTTGPVRPYWSSQAPTVGPLSKSPKHPSTPNHQ